MPKIRLPTHAIQVMFFIFVLSDIRAVSKKAQVRKEVVV